MTISQSSHSSSRLLPHYNTGTRYPSMGTPLSFIKKKHRTKTQPFVTNITTLSLPNKLQPSLKKVYTPTYFLTFFLFPSRALKDAAQMKVELDDLHAQISIVNKNKVHGMGSFFIFCCSKFSFHYFFYYFCNEI